MDIEPRQSFLMAAKYAFLSQGIQPGSFVIFNFPNVQRELEVEEGNDGCSNAASIKQNSNVTVKKPYVCAIRFICNKEVTPKSGLNIVHNQRVHTGDKHYVCSMYDKGYALKSHLKRHQRIDIDKPYICDTCHKRFKLNTNMKRHQRIHTGEKPYVCGRCDTRFTQKSSLKRHQRIHTTEKPVCGTCHEVFTMKSDLNIHQCIHNVCGTCHKGFSQKSSLKQHQLLHTGDKPYVCYTCGKGFTQKNNLKRHQRVHEKNLMNINHVLNDLNT